MPVKAKVGADSPTGILPHSAGQIRIIQKATHESAHLVDIAFFD
jgi:hypothetical protein